MVKVGLKEGGLALPVSLSLRLIPSSPPPPPPPQPRSDTVEEAPPPQDAVEKNRLPVVDEFEMALEDAWQDDPQLESPTDSREDKSTVAEERVPSSPPPPPPPPPPPHQGEDTDPPPPPLELPSSTPSQTTGPPQNELEGASQSLEQAGLALEPVPELGAGGAEELQEQVCSEFGGPFVCNASDDSDAEEEEGEEEEGEEEEDSEEEEVYQRFERVWPIDRSMLSALSPEYAAAALTVFEKLQREPEPYDPFKPYDIQPKPFQVVFPKIERAPTPPPLPEIGELPPPGVVSVRRKPTIPFAIQDQKAAVERRQAAERRAHKGLCYEDYLETTYGLEQLYLPRRTE